MDTRDAGSPASPVKTKLIKESGYPKGATQNAVQFREKHRERFIVLSRGQTSPWPGHVYGVGDELIGEIDHLLIEKVSAASRTRS